MPIIAEKIRDLRFFSRHQTLWAFLVVLLLSLWTLNANPFAGQTVAPFDLLLAQSGWETVPWDDKVMNYEASDILDSQLPTWTTLKEQIRAGKGALWYPNAAGGKAMDIEPFNPAFLVFLLIHNNALAYYMVGLFKLVISGLGCYLLLRTFLKWAPSMWGGIVFMLCGFNVAWFFYDQVTTAMWIPWLLAATVMYLKTEDARWLPAISATSALLIFGGFFSVAAFGFYAFGLLVLTWNANDFFVHYVRSSDKDNKTLWLLLKKSALPMFAAGIAFMLAGVILVPFISGLTGINLSYRSGATFGAGTIFGAGTNFKNGIEDLMLLFYYEYPPHIERTAYIGLPVVILAFLSIFRLFRSNNEDYRKFIFFNLLLVIVTTLITFGLLPHEFIKSLPIFSNNSWGRLVVILLLGLSVLSAAGLDVLISEVPSFLSRHLKTGPLIARRTVVFLAIPLFAFQFGSQKIFFNDCVAVVPSAWFYPLTPSIKYVREHLKPLQSVIADKSFLIAGTLGAYGIPEWYGHSLFTDKEKKVLGDMVVFPFSSPTSCFIDPANIFFNSPLMDKMAVKYLLIGKNVTLRKMMDLSLFRNRWDLVDLENNIAVLENRHVTNSAYFVSDLDPSNDQLDFSGLDVRRPSSDEINIDYSGGGPGWVVLPMRLNPGWRAFVDDRQVKHDKYLGILPAIPVNGPSRIKYIYRPLPFRNGMTVSLIGVIILLLFAGYCFRQDKGTSTCRSSTIRGYISSGFLVKIRVVMPALPSVKPQPKLRG